MKQQFLGDFTLLHGGEVYTIADSIFVKLKDGRRAKIRAAKDAAGFPYVQVEVFEPQIAMGNGGGERHTQFNPEI